MGDSSTKPPDVFIPPVIKLLVLQRMSDVRTTEADCGAEGWKASPVTFGEKRSWLGDSWKAVATTGLAAIEHFNNRDPTYVPEFANLAGCDKKYEVTVKGEQKKLQALMLKQLLKSAQETRHCRR